MFKMYDLTEMYLNIWDLVNDEETDLDSLELALQEVEENITVKAENMAKLIKNIEGNVKVLKDEEKRLQGKRRALENKIVGIKDYLEYQLRNMDLKKVQGDIFTVAIQKNPPTVKFTDEELIPEKYKEQIITVKIPKKAILDDIKEGIEVPGAEMIQGESLRIR